MCPMAATDLAHSGQRDDMWGLMVTAAAMMLPVSPFERVLKRWRWIRAHS